FSVGNGSGTQSCKKLIVMYRGCLETDGSPGSNSYRIQNSGMLRFRGNHPVICEPEAEIIIEDGGVIEVK
ncbi:MAG: hypothetical protein KA161_08950, partial [Saprospiraceae bacterium]|nr:hypothetical protein [Saprospiraceae bacterium]